MRKRNILLLTILVVIAVVGGMLAVRYLPGIVPESQCSEVYRRYAHVPGVEAAFVKGFPINDTLGVDVTLLHATDSAGWAYLMNKFDLPKAMLELAETRKDHLLSERQVLRNHPEKKAITQGELRDPNLTEDDVELCVIDYFEKEICVFHVLNARQLEAVKDYSFDKTTTNINN